MTLFLRKMSLGWFLMVRYEDGTIEVLSYVTDAAIKEIKA